MALLAYCGYLAKMVWPTGLAAPYPPRIDPRWLACAACFFILLSVTVVAIVLARRGKPYFAAGWFWYLGMLAPVSGFILIGNHAMADRYTYLPLIGVFIALTWSAGDLFKRVRVSSRWWFAVTLLAVLAVLSFFQVRNWRESEVYWRHVIAVTDGNAFAENSLGAFLWDRRPELRSEAADHWRKALSIIPNDALANANLATVLCEQGDVHDAIAHYIIAMRWDPDNLNTITNFAYALEKAGRMSDAENGFREAVRLEPDNPYMLDNLGCALARRGRASEAIPYHRRAVDSAPQVARFRTDFGTALLAADSIDGCVEQCQAAVRLAPQDVSARLVLAKAYSRMGKSHEARDQWQAILTIQPWNLDALEGLERSRPARGGDSYPTPRGAPRKNRDAYAGSPCKSDSPM